MGVRTRIADGLTRAAKAFGDSVPAEFLAGEQAAQMTPASPFSPGTPIGPYDGYDRTPRSRDFVTGYNIATRPRIHERVSFDTLTGLIEAYDVAQICIWHRIDSVRSLDWKLIAEDGYSGDVTDAIAVGMEALKKPDRENRFEAWLAKWLYGVLAYDAAPLARMRNRGGQCIGLQVVDGTTIAPLLDYWGNSPKAIAPGEPEPEAYVQYVNGLPWNWLTRSDLVYEPFRPIPRSIYGRAPLESIILNANTDIRFQLYFLQRFTEGNIPEAFAAAPESWTPDQIEQFQDYWDGFMYGDQSRKHQVRWMPGGTKLAWSNEKDFSDVFSLFLMRKTTAAYHVVPSDLGFTETVNKSSGESQADVQHRVGDLPLIRYVQGVITSFLQDDLGLPVKHAFDLGEEQDDRLNQAQADDIYVKNGTISPTDLRQQRFGLEEPEGRPVPRYIFTERSGPIPLSALMSVAGTIDPETAAPMPGVPLPEKAFTEVQGVLSVPPLLDEPLAEQEYGPCAIPPAGPPQPGVVSKEAAPGITTGTGIVGYDGPGQDDDDDEGLVDLTPTAAVAKSELAAFRRFTKTRRRAGDWRDFTFTATDPVTAHRLNDAGRLAVRKDAGEIAVAGLAVQAGDTGRVLMLQRALTAGDPAAGTWEFPGGHIEQGETPLQGAWREWAEETGCIPPPGIQTGDWVSPNGIYQGIVWTVPAEASVPVRTDTAISNPDDPDGDQVEAIAWWDPAQLPGNPAVRPELLAAIDLVMQALGLAGGAIPCQADESTCPCGIPVVYDESNGWQHGDGSISHDDGESVSDKMAAVAKQAGLPCACCSGSGEHLTGHECYRCDASGSVQGDELRAPFCADVFRDPALHAQGCPNCGLPPFLGSSAVAKAGGADPKVSDWPGWALSDQAIDWWAPRVTAAVTAAVPSSRRKRLAADYIAAFPPADNQQQRKRDRNAAAVAWLTAQGIDLAVVLAALVTGILTDAFLIGLVSAVAVISDQPVDAGGWRPGDGDAAAAVAGELGASVGLAALLATAEVAAGRMGGTITAALARALTDADDVAGATEGLGAVVADPKLAENTVVHEIATGSAEAAEDSYDEQGIDQVDILNGPNPCATCLNLAATNPHPPGLVPVHPNCQCAEVPHGSHWLARTATAR